MCRVVSGLHCRGVPLRRGSGSSGLCVVRQGWKGQSQANAYRCHQKSLSHVCSPERRGDPLFLLALQQISPKQLLSQREDFILPGTIPCKINPLTDKPASEPQPGSPQRALQPLRACNSHRRCRADTPHSSALSYMNGRETGCLTAVTGVIQREGSVRAKIETDRIASQFRFKQPSPRRHEKGASRLPFASKKCLSSACRSARRPGLPDRCSWRWGG